MGSSPQPQSYVASRLAQSNSGLWRRALTRLCTKHSLEFHRVENTGHGHENHVMETYHVAADLLDDVYQEMSGIPVTEL